MVDRDTLAFELHRPDGPVEPDCGVTLEPLGVRVAPRGANLAVGDHELRL